MMKEKISLIILIKKNFRTNLKKYTDPYKKNFKVILRT